VTCREISDCLILEGFLTVQLFFMLATEVFGRLVVLAWLWGRCVKAQRIETTEVFEGNLDETILGSFAWLPVSVRLDRDFLPLYQRRRFFLTV
jgi:hypothetical protein